MIPRKQSATKASFNPRHRWDTAVRIVKLQLHDDPGLEDVWTKKIVGMLELRNRFREEFKGSGDSQFEAKFPLYSSLLSTVEDSTIGGDRDLIEAVLLCSADLGSIHSEWKHPRFDSLFLGAYRKMFYDVTALFTDSSMIFQYVISPMLSADTDKLAVGHIWKILALAGGLSMLRRKGLGSEPIKAEDIERLLQLASFRHCSAILQYTSAGTRFFADNPAAMLSINALTAFDGIRSSKRRADYIAELSSVARNNFNTLLQSELKLLSVPEDEVRKLVEYDGQFNPYADINTIETCEHITFINNEDIQEQDE